MSATDSPETSYKDTTDAHLVQLPKHYGIKLATLDTMLITKSWAAGIAFHPILAIK